jgi:hypothetical protein
MCAVSAVRSLRGCARTRNRAEHGVLADPIRARAENRRYLESEYGCLRCKLRGVGTSARTRYLERCPRRTGSGATP